MVDRACLRELIAAIDREKAQRKVQEISANIEAEARHKGATTKDKAKREVKKKR